MKRFFALLVCINCISVNASLAAEQKEILTVNFLGRFHPLLVHLPIGLIIFWFVLECFIWKTKKHELKGVRILLVGLTALSSILSCIAGYFLSWDGGYNEQSLQLHQWSGIGLAVITSILFLCTCFSYKKSFSRVYYPGLLICTALLFYVGHKGGTLTHGEEFISISNITETTAERPVITDVNKALVYEQIVHYFLVEKCASCHNEGKKKGDFVLTSYAGLMKGGESGKVIFEGNPENSELYRLITLPPTDKKAMPPDGKDPLTKQEIEIIHWWIKNGAPANKTVADLKADKSILNAITLAAHVEKRKDFVEGVQVEEAGEDVINHVTQQGFVVLPLAKEGTNVLNVKVSELSRRKLTKRNIESLGKIKDQIVFLDMRESSFSDSAGSILKELSNLNKLHLQKTNISDSTLFYLKDLKHLEYLNIYDTKITDRGLEYLKNLSSLKKLYLWKTNVSTAALDNLRKKNPQLEVNFN